MHFFFLGSWDQHHVPALEVSCVLEQAETYICLSITKGKQLWSLKRCEKEKEIRNHQSPITRDQDQEEEADLCLHNRRKREEVQGGLGMYLPKVSMGQLWNLFSPSALCILHLPVCLSA